MRTFLLAFAAAWSTEVAVETAQAVEAVPMDPDAVLDGNATKVESGSSETEGDIIIRGRRPRRRRRHRHHGPVVVINGGRRRYYRHRPVVVVHDSRRRVVVYAPNPHPVVVTNPYPQAYGQCTGYEQNNWRYNGKSTFQSNMRFCTRECRGRGFGNGRIGQQNCVQNCIQNRGFTYACSQCFGMLSTCATLQCQYSFGGNVERRACTANQCIPQFQQCSGIYDMPYGFQPGTPYSFSEEEAKEGDQASAGEYASDQSKAYKRSANRGRLSLQETKSAEATDAAAEDEEDEMADSFAETSADAEHDDDDQDDEDDQGDEDDEDEDDEQDGQTAQQMAGMA